MPKDTFNNLNEDKKKRIFDAAVEEFSVKRFSQASINQMVRNAGISRGSFYQYFENKEDIYLYVLGEIGKEKLEVIGSARKLKPDADFFEAYMHMVGFAVEWSKTKPKYYRIGMLMEFDDSHFIAKLRTLLPEGFALLRDMIDRDRQLGRVKPDIDPKLVVDIIYTLHLHLLTQYYQNGTQEDLVKRVRDIINIVKDGIANN